MMPFLFVVARSVTKARKASPVGLNDVIVVPSGFDSVPMGAKLKKRKKSLDFSTADKGEPTKPESSAATFWLETEKAPPRQAIVAQSRLQNAFT